MTSVSDMAKHLAAGDTKEAIAAAPIIYRFYKHTPREDVDSRYYELRTKLNYAEEEMERAFANRGEDPEAYEVAVEQFKPYADSGLIERFHRIERTVNRLVTERGRLRKAEGKSDYVEGRIKGIETMINRERLKFNEDYYKTIVRKDIEAMEELFGLPDLED
jgi:hypothetical protein